MSAAGIEMGGLGAFSRVAGAGIGVLAAVIGGTAVVALAKIGDNAVLAKKRLGDVFQNPELGSKLFDQLEDGAVKLHTDVTSLTGPAETLFRIIRANSSLRFLTLPPGLAEQAQTLFKIIRSGTGTNAEADKGLSSFLGEVARSGKLSAEAVKQLDAVSPAAAAALAKVFNQPDVERFEQMLAKMPASIDRLRLAPEDFTGNLWATLGVAVSPDGELIGFELTRADGAKFRVAFDARSAFYGVVAMTLRGIEDALTRGAPGGTA